MNDFPVGSVHGQWTVLATQAPSGRPERALCRCSCGNEREVRRSKIRGGHSSRCKSCAIKMRGSGIRGTPTYSSWLSMKSRCLPRHKDRKWYYDRGISVCRRWAESYEAFLEDMGERPVGMTLDRINPDVGYEPGNCRWATHSEQAYNRRGRASKFRGVTKETGRGIVRWVPVITVDGRQKKLGRFKTEGAAAEALAAAGGV